MIPNRLIASFLILCLTFTQAAQAYSLAWLPHQPTHNTNQRQAAVSLINNKGDLGKTLNDLGQSQNVKALVTAMVTAGMLQGLNATAGSQKVNAQSSFPEQLQKNLLNNTASAVVNHAINGGDLQQQLEQSIRSAFIDTGSAQGANGIGDLYQNHTLNDFTHQLAHAIAGCAAGAAKANDCSSGALGAVVGEMSAELYGGARLNSSNLDIPALQTDTANFARMMAGIAVAISGGDAASINLAADAGGNAAQNNYLTHDQTIAKLTELAAAKDEKAKAAIKQKYDAISQANNDAGYKDLAEGGVMAGYQMGQDKAGLTAMLTGPTNCANDFACQVEVNKSLNEIQGVYEGYNSVNLFFNVVPAVQAGILPLGVVADGVAELLGGANVGLRVSTTISSERAVSYLVDNGMSVDRATDFVASFDGPISARLVRSGENLYRYTDVAESTGSFVTRNLFTNPSSTIEGLYLAPYGNGATLVQQVTSTGRSIVLEGGVANGGVEVQQSLLVNKNVFNFGTGKGY